MVGSVIDNSANANLGNLTQDGQTVIENLAKNIVMTVAGENKSTFDGWCMPNYSAPIDLAGHNSASNQYEAPKNGYVVLSKQINGNYWINGTQMSASSSDTKAGDTNVIPLAIGDKIYATNTSVFRYYPCKGE